MPARAGAAATIPTGSQQQFERIAGGACRPREVADAPSPAPGDTSSPAPADTSSPGGGEASPEPTSSPSPGPSYQPVLPGPPLGPIKLTPPLPTPAVTAVPAPTPTASASGSPAPAVIAPAPESPQPLVPKGEATPLPSPTPSAAPSAYPTLAPNQFALRADSADRQPTQGHPSDFSGHVVFFYDQGQIVADHAHYDGDHTFTMTGHPYLINARKDAILYADSIVYDLHTHQAVLKNGRGETSEGVDVGLLYYRAKTLTAMPRVTHGIDANFSTCTNERGGYHIHSKTIDIIPGDKLVARKNYLILGAAAVLYIPLIVIPLRNTPGYRRVSFFPEFGYDQYDGFFVRAKLGFGTGPQYFGYYSVDYYTKRGLGLGYNGTIARKDNKRLDTVSFYTINDRIAGARQTNYALQDTENFSPRLHGQFGVTYNSSFGTTGFSLPPQYGIAANLTHTGYVSSESLSFTRSSQGSQTSSVNTAFIDTLRLSNSLSQAFNISYGRFDSSLGNVSTNSSSLHLNSLTNLFGRWANYVLTVDKTDSTTPTGYDKVPELAIQPHLLLPGLLRPLQESFTLGKYTEPQYAFSTTRFDTTLNYPQYFQLFRAASLQTNVRYEQDLYGTGDEKAFVTQNATLSAPFGHHVVASLGYNDQYPIGPALVPFQTLDHLSSAFKSGTEALHFFNENYYNLTLTTGTNFNGQAEPIAYQFSSEPTLRSLVLVGGSWNPGPGNGFFTTNTQIVTPIGRDMDIAFSTNFDWKNKGRLENKTIYFHKIIGGCYEFRVNYIEDLKSVNVTFDLLAFPTRAAGFGLGQSGSAIVPGNFTL